MSANRSHDLRLYLELGSFAKVVAELDRRKIVTKHRNKSYQNIGAAYPSLTVPSPISSRTASTSGKVITAANGSRESMMQSWNAASSGLFVVGKDKLSLDGLDLREVVMRMTQRGDVVSEGKGAACLDNPLNAVAWLAGKLGQRGRQLRAGDIVLSGALGPMVPVNPGDTFESTITGLGTVSARFGEQ
jgi:2-keto-4-pentenoate hydratase